MKKNLFLVGLLCIVFLSGCASSKLNTLAKRVDSLENGQSALSTRVDLLGVKTNAIEQRLSALEKAILASIKKSVGKYKKENGKDPKVAFHHKIRIDNFANGEFKLTKKMKAQIRAYHIYLAEKLKEKKTLSLEIEGWTDASGDNSFNQALSEKRAETVHLYLESLMNNKERQKIKIHAIGKGRHEMVGGQYRYVSFDIS